MEKGDKKRAEHFMYLREWFKENKEFKEIIFLLEQNDPKIRGVPKEYKRNYLGFFEEIALMVNSRLIQPSVAQYMFGYYAILCRQNKHFWFEFEPEHKYWQVFNTFCGKMEEAEKVFSYGRFQL